VDYGPVVFPSHIGKVFHVKIVCLVLVVFGYIFSAYILLYFIVSYRFTQRGSFVYCCFSQHFTRWFFLVSSLYCLMGLEFIQNLSEVVVNISFELADSV
jgi:hypothetical protein